MRSGGAAAQRHRGVDGPVEQLRGVGSEGLDALAQATQCLLRADRRDRLRPRRRRADDRRGRLPVLLARRRRCRARRGDGARGGGRPGVPGSLGTAAGARGHARQHPHRRFGGGAAHRAGRRRQRTLGGAAGRAGVRRRDRHGDRCRQPAACARRSAWELVADRTDGEPRPDDEPARRERRPHAGAARGSDDLVPDIPAESSRRSCPRRSARWTGDSGTEWLAELRHVTVVMARLLDREVDRRKAIDRSQRAMRAFQETIVRFEGASKPGMDNKGLTLSAVFGLPPRAHEDDAERACGRPRRCGRSSPSSISPCSVGVASGRAFCGLFGTDLRREYALLRGRHQPRRPARVRGRRRHPVRRA